MRGRTSNAMPRSFRYAQTACEVGAAGLAEVIENRRQRVDDGLILRAPCNRARAVGSFRRGAGSRRTWWGATSRRRSCSSATNCGRQLASPTELISSLKPVSPERLQDLHHHLDHFGVDGRRIGADGLRADLEELAVAAFLRALAAEHGSDVVELLDAGSLVEAMLDVGAHHRGGGFRAEGERGAVAVLEGVHLFADDVGFFADAAGEQSGLFEHAACGFRGSCTTRKTSRATASTWFQTRWTRAAGYPACP